MAMRIVPLDCMGASTGAVVAVVLQQSPITTCAAARKRATRVTVVVLAGGVGDLPSKVSARRQQAGDFQPLAPGLQLGQRADIPQQVRHARRSLARGQGPAGALNAGSLRQLCSVNVLGAMTRRIPRLSRSVLLYYRIITWRENGSRPNSRLLRPRQEVPARPVSLSAAKNLGGGAGAG